MFGGGVVVAGALAPAGHTGQRALAAGRAPGWIATVLVLALVFLASNLALQFGAARLPANVTAVVMLTEVVFAAGSAHLLGGGAFRRRCGRAARSSSARRCSRRAPGR